MLVVLLIGIFSLSSCKKGEAPPIPPESTFVLQGINGDTSAKAAPGILYQNFGQAAGLVGVWTLISTVAMAIPVTAYNAAMKQTAHHISGDRWVWEYTFSYGIGLNTSYTFQLYSETLKDKITWEMYISKTGDYDKFLWYTGTSNLEGTAGQWIIYRSPTENHELLQIDWTRNTDDATGSLKYTNIEPESTENGGYIYYGNDQAGEYDAFFDIFNKGTDNLIEIDLNTTYHNGRIKNEKFYFDNLWHCWNTQLLDDYCSNPTK